MQQPRHPGARTFTAPSFYLTGRQPLRPGVILLAIAVAVGAVGGMVYAMSHTRQARMNSDAPSRASGTSSAGDDDDDPNQVDTIVLGDPGDAPRPAKRGDHVSSVHPTILITLPRSGDKVGLIPNSAAGRLLYEWLAAFNKGNSRGLQNALPTVAPEAVAAAEMELRRQTGGFNLLSAKEVQPGVLVFRMRDNTTAGVEVLGTLQVAAGSGPAEIASFSLRAVDGVR